MSDVNKEADTNKEKEHWSENYEYSHTDKYDKELKKMWDLDCKVENGSGCVECRKCGGGISALCQCAYKRFINGISFEIFQEWERLDKCSNWINKYTFEIESLWKTREIYVQSKCYYNYEHIK